jgi:energy-coupling factor transport system substrate-specific component
MPAQGGRFTLRVAASAVAFTRALIIDRGTTMHHATATSFRSSTRRTDPRWRVVDIVVASVLGVASALVFFAWNQVYAPVTAPLEALLPGSQALFYGIWLFAGVLGGLVIRKPGAALFTELVAAVVSALLGAQWGGFATIEAGLVQGLGAELIFLIFLYHRWNVIVAMLAGAAAGLAMAVNDIIGYYLASGSAFQAIYTISGIISGAVIAGLGSWFIVRGLARTGALNRFASGRLGTR